MSNGFFSSSIKFFGATVLITLANLARDISIAAAFGTAAAADRFFLVATLLIFILTVLAGATRSVYIPVLLQALSRSREEFDVISRRLVSINIRGAVFGGLAVCIAAAALSLIPAISTSPALDESISILIAITPMYALAAFVDMNQATLQARDRILMPNFARLGLPLGIVVGAWIAADSLGIYGLAIGGLVGSGVAAIIIGEILRRERMLPPSVRLQHEVMLAVRNGVLALTLSSSIAYINPVISTWMAGFLEAGAVSILGYANRLTVGLAALLVSSFTPVFLHHFSRHIADKNTGAIRSLYTNFFAGAPWLGVLMTLATWLLSGLIAPFLYQRGHFTAADTRAVVSIIDIYALQFPFFLASTPSFTLISALSKNYAFIGLNLILLATNFVGGFALMHAYGLEGLAFSTTVVYAVSLLSLNVYLWKEGTAKLDSSSLISGAAAILSMALAIFVIQRFELKLTSASAPIVYVQALLLLAAVVLAGAAINWQRVAPYLKRTV